MNANIDNICIELNTFALSLKQEAKAKIKEALPKTNMVSMPVSQAQPKSYVSNPERPWLLAGGTALAVGALGTIFSWGSWSYAVGGAGVASIIYGCVIKNKSQKRQNASTTQQATSEPKGYEIAEKVIEVSKFVESKWRTKVEECKGSVQHAIEVSSASSNLKVSLIGQTYTTERVSIDFDTTVSRLDTQPSMSFPSILSEFEKTVTNSIDKAATDQIVIYKKISNQL